MEIGRDNVQKVRDKKQEYKLENIPAYKGLGGVSSIWLIGDY